MCEMEGMVRCRGKKREIDIQGVPGGMSDILRTESLRHSKLKIFYYNFPLEA